MSKGISPVLVVGGVVGVGLLALALSPRARQTAAAGLEQVAEVAEGTMDWISRVISRVSAHEGNYDSLNLNSDGAGLSFGILQWAQKPGTLGTLLNALYLTDPERFSATFGPSSVELLQVTLAGGVAPVAGVLLWKEPWISRFKAAGSDPVFTAVQDRMAAEGDHFQGAVKAAYALGFATERSVALMYDTSVQQGPGFAKKLATRVRNQFAGRPAQVADVLQSYAEQAPAHFRRVETPTEPYPVSHISWKQVGKEWHAFAGSFDLYNGILKRRMGIVRDPGLSDSVVVLPGQV